MQPRTRSLTSLWPPSSRGRRRRTLELAGPMTESTGPTDQPANRALLSVMLILSPGSHHDCVARPSYGSASALGPPFPHLPIRAHARLDPPRLPRPVLDPVARLPRLSRHHEPVPAPQLAEG
jgi:hypothetical protein